MAFLFCPRNKAGYSSWLDEYNTERPHGALGGVTPAKYVKKLREKTKKLLKKKKNPNVQAGIENLGWSAVLTLLRKIEVE